MGQFNDLKKKSYSSNETPEQKIEGKLRQVIAKDDEEALKATLKKLKEKNKYSEHVNFVVGAIHSKEGHSYSTAYVKELEVDAKAVRPTVEIATVVPNREGAGGAAKDEKQLQA